MARKKVLVITSTFPRWQNDTDPPFVYELSKRLARKFDVAVLAPNYPGALRYEIMDGIKVHRFRYFWSRFEMLAGSSGILPTLKNNKLYYLLVPFFVLAEFFALLVIVVKSKPDVVHAHWVVPQGLVAAIVKKITGTSLVVTAHGGDVFGLQWWPFGFLKRVSLQSADRITVVSSVIKQAVSRISPSIVQPIILPMGVDSVHFNLKVTGDSIRDKYGVKGPLLLFVGRLTEKKGVKYLLKAMPTIIRNSPDVKLLVVGSGEEADILNQLCDSLDIVESVVFTGSIPNSDLPLFYSAADIFIGPSIRAEDGDTEGFGLTFVEAGMSGCILIGSNVGGISDIINNKKTGFLVEEKNPAAIACAVIDAIDLQDDWPSMTEVTRRELVSRFDWQVVAGEYSKILYDIAKL